MCAQLFKRPTEIIKYFNSKVRVFDIVFILNCTYCLNSYYSNGILDIVKLTVYVINYYTCSLL